MNEENKKYDHIARSALCVALVLLIASAMSSCKARSVTTSSVSANNTTAQTEVRYVRDTLYSMQRDTIKQWTAGDTIVQVQVKYKDRIRTLNLTDTIVKRDTIRIDQEVKAPPQPSQKRKSLWWLWLLIGISIYPAYKLIRRVSI